MARRLACRFASLAAAASLVLSACGQGGGSSGSSGGGSSSGGTTTLYTAPAAENLTVADVQKAIAQAAAEATARSTPAVIAVVDRTGNVLVVYAMTGAPATARIPAAASGNNHDAQNLDVPASWAAIAKAITGAYLSSGGNAFSTRTASMIVQQHFPPSPATSGLESGPLFGVQFSQLPCSDLSQRFNPGGGAAAAIGPKRSPLGLAADPGGFPLYKNGVVVGGVGVLADGQYGLDANVLDVDDNPDEAIALAASVGLDAPDAIRADKITVDGTSLRYSDETLATLKTTPASAPAFSTLTGALTAVTGYYDGTTVLAGQAYGSEASGIRKATTAEFSNPDAFVLSDGSGNNRYAARGATDAADVTQPLSAAEVTALLEEAFKIMSRARAQIRQPLNSRAEVTISVVDTRGAILGMVRAPDAPLFGIDVSLQKARTVAFMSGPHAAADLLADPSADVQSFVGNMRTVLADPLALTGKTAFGARGIANLSRPFFPDGEDGRPNGPLSRPFADWSPFSTGLQSALIAANLTDGGNDARCTALPDTSAGQNRLQNGMQIFSGGVPIYRGSTLVGGIGVSGDGIDQDDMISFLGLYNAAQRLGTIQEAPAAIRSDQIVVTLAGESVRLRYVNCPFSPFLDTSDQNVCDGK